LTEYIYTEKENITNIADAIRTVSNTENKLSLTEMEAMILSLKGNTSNTITNSYEYTYNSSSNEELSTMISSYQTTINNIVTRYEYTYDNFYNITNIKKYENNIFVEEKLYQYNDKNELIKETISRDSEDILLTNYTYDILGNITSITRQIKR
jgi:hypothetical protein